MYLFLSDTNKDSVEEWVNKRSIEVILLSLLLDRLEKMESWTKLLNPWDFE